MLILDYQFQFLPFLHYLWLDFPVAQLLWSFVLVFEILHTKNSDKKKNGISDLHVMFFRLLFCLFLLQQQLFFGLALLTTTLDKVNESKKHIHNSVAALLIFSSLSVKPNNLLVAVVCIQLHNFVSKQIQLYSFSAGQTAHFKLWNFKSQILSLLMMILCLFYFASKNCLRFDALNPNNLDSSPTTIFFALCFIASLLINIADINIAIAKSRFQTNFPSVSALLLTTMPSYVSVSATIKFTFVNCANFLDAILPYINTISFCVAALAICAFFRQIFLSKLLNTFGLLSIAFGLLTLNVLKNDASLATFIDILNVVGFYFSTQFISMFIFVISIQPVISEFKNIKSFDYLKGLWTRDKRTSLSLIVASFSLSGVMPPTMGFFAYSRILKLFVKTNTSEVFLFSLLAFLLIANLRFCSKVISYIIFYKAEEKYYLSPQVGGLRTSSFLMSIALMFGFLIKSFMF